MWNPLPVSLWIQLKVLPSHLRLCPSLGSQGQQRGSSLASCQSRGVTSQGSSSLSKKRLENAPELWPQHRPAPRPVLSPARAAGPRPAGAGRPGHWPRRALGGKGGADILGCWSPAPAIPINGPVPRTEGSWLASSSPGGSALPAEGTELARACPSSVSTRTRAQSHRSTARGAQGQDP